jgi:hypothetical protein
MGGDEKIFKKPVNAGAPFYVWQQIRAHIRGPMIQPDPLSQKNHE